MARQSGPPLIEPYLDVSRSIYGSNPYNLIPLRFKGQRSDQVVLSSDDIWCPLTGTYVGSMDCLTLGRETNVTFAKSPVFSKDYPPVCAKRRVSSSCTSSVITHYEFDSYHWDVYLNISPLNTLDWYALLFDPNGKEYTSVSGMLKIVLGTVGEFVVYSHRIVKAIEDHLFDDKLLLVHSWPVNWNVYSTVEWIDKSYRLTGGCVFRNKGSYLATDKLSSFDRIEHHLPHNYDDSFSRQSVLETDSRGPFLESVFRRLESLCPHGTVCARGHIGSACYGGVRICSQCSKQYGVLLLDCRCLRRQSRVPDNNNNDVI